MQDSDHKPARIMVVDDQEINRRLLEALLLPLGHQVVLAGDGSRCLELLEREPFDLILLDVMMPGMDGLEVARRIKRDPATKGIPVIMVTALREVEDKVAALEAGADDFLTKPVDRAELRARVRSQLKVKAYNDSLLNYQRELEAAVESRTRQLRQALAGLRNASHDTILRLARAAEYKDEETGAHILRMSKCAAAVARRLGLEAATVEAIFYAAPMHDVGKIGIPDQVLLKPGPLTPAEWEVMQTHTLIGAGILSGAERGFLKLAEVIALTHHEKFDGTGYPRGLRGREIPLAGRVVAIADVFDALMSKRPYKEPFPLERSLGIIQEGRGRHFDPRVVDAFLAIKDEILAIRAQHPDHEPGNLARINEYLAGSARPPRGPVAQNG